MWLCSFSSNDWKAMTRRGYLPILVHRWFLNGEGWAYHPSLESSLLDLVKDAESLLKHPKDGFFQVKVGIGWLVGDTFSDVDCPNRQAAGRNPFVFRAVLIRASTLTENLANALYRRLCNVRLPVSEGENDALCIKLDDRPKREDSSVTVAPPFPGVAQTDLVQQASPTPEQKEPDSRGWALLHMPKSESVFTQKSIRLAGSVGVGFGIAALVVYALLKPDVVVIASALWIVFCWLLLSWGGGKESKNNRSESPGEDSTFSSPTFDERR